MKTTLDLNDVLLANAKALAAARRTTLTRVIEEGLRLRLEGPRRPKLATPVPLPVFAGKGGLVKGIDPRSNQSLLEAADSDDA